MKDFKQVTGYDDAGEPIIATDHTTCASVSNDLLCTLPWHIGFSNEIADNLGAGKWQQYLVRYEVYNVCANNGRHVAWAASKEHAEFIINAVNKLGA